MQLDINIIKAVANKLELAPLDIIARPLKTQALVSDTTQKFLIYTTKDKQPKAFVLISAAKTPLAIKSGYEKLCELTSKVGTELAKNLLMPLDVAESNGLTYSISAYHRPLHTKFIAKHMDIWRVRQPLIQWVINVAEATKTVATAAEIENSFTQPLLALSEAVDLKPEYKKTAMDALNAIEKRYWQPCFVCAHNDLWWGNVLSSKQHQFVLIDWDGVMLKGYAFYDFMRVIGSFKLTKTALKKALQQYCSVMQCDDMQAQYYLISAFAYLYSDLGGWQYERFLLLLDDCMQTLQKIVSMKKL